MDSAEFLLGTVTAVSSADGIQIQLDGQDEAMSKYYKMMINGADWPSVGSRVVVMKHSGTYVVMGKIGTPSQNAGKVNRGGDTMTGDLNIRKNNPASTLRNTSMDAASASYPEAKSSPGFLIYDKNGQAVAQYTERYETSGATGLLIGGAKVIDGSRVWNYLRLLVKPDGTFQVLVTSPAAWRTALGALYKAGDTMTGTLIIRDANLNMDDPNFTVGTRPSTNQWSKPFRIRDADGKTLGRIQGFYGTDGTCGLQLYADQLVNGEGKYNFISLNIGETGVASVNMNHPEAWRSALNALNKSGDTMTGSLTLSAGNAGIYEDTTAYEVGVPPSSDFYTVGLRNRDKNGTVFTAFNSALLSNGNIAVRMIVTKGSISNYLQLVIDSNNNQSISVSNAQAWRKALGLGTNGAFPITVAQGGTGNTGTATETTLANIAAAGTGVTLLDASFCSWGKLAMLFVHGKTTAALTGPAVLFTVVSGKRPVSNAPVQIGRSPDHNALIGSNGQAQLGGSLSSGTEFSCAAVYLLP